MTWTTPKTWVAAEFVDASEMNIHVRDNLTDLQTRLTGASTSFTITSAGSSGITIGNALQLNTWKLMQEKFAWFRIHLTMGTTSAFTGTFALGPLPFTISGTSEQTCACFVKDASASSRWGGATWLDGSITSQIFRLLVSDGTSGAGSTIPFTWTTSDELFVQGVVETT